jgi:hypothetical protein
MGLTKIRNTKSSKREDGKVYVSKGNHDNDKSIIKKIDNNTIYLIKNSNGDEIAYINETKLNENIEYLYSIADQKLSSLKDKDKKIYEEMKMDIYNISMSTKISQILFTKFDVFKNIKNLDPASVGFFFQTCKLNNGMIFCDTSDIKDEMEKNINDTVLSYDGVTFTVHKKGKSNHVYIMVGTNFQGFTPENKKYLNNFKTVTISMVDKNGNVVKEDTMQTSSNTSVVIWIFIILIILLLLIVGIVLYKRS